MATSRVSDRPTTQRQYATQVALTAALVQAIRTLWSAASPLSSDTAWDTFRAAVQAVVPHYAQMAARQSLDNYLLARADAGIIGQPRIRLLPDPPASKIDAGLAWARRAEAEAAGIEAAILRRAETAMDKVMLDEARAQTVAAVEGDDRALGFRRVPRPDACAWCLALATRKTSRRGLAGDFKRYGAGSMGGAEHWGVYKSRAAAGQIPGGDLGEVNRFHRNCHCVVEPIFSPSFVIPDWLQEVDQLYRETGDFNHFRRLIEARRRGESATSGPTPDPVPVIPAPAAQQTQVAAIADLLGRLVA